MEIPVFNPPYLSMIFEPQISPQRPWRVNGDHSFYAQGIMVEVPDGFRTDLASVPLALAWLYDPNGKHQRAAVFHDWLYYRKATERFAADAVFRIIMRQDGVSWLRRVSMYYAVRLFGWMAWRAKSD